MKEKLTKIGSFVGYLFLLARLNPALAQVEEIYVKKPDEVEIEKIGPVLAGILRIAFVVALILTFVFLIWGGLQWITSGGDKAKYEEARNRITAALVGLAIIVLAWLIIKLVAYFFGLPDIFGGQAVELPKLYE